MKERYDSAIFLAPGERHGFIAAVGGVREVDPDEVIEEEIDNVDVLVPFEFQVQIVDESYVPHDMVSDPNYLIPVRPSQVSFCEN